VRPCASTIFMDGRKSVCPCAHTISRDVNKRGSLWTNDFQGRTQNAASLCTQNLEVPKQKRFSYARTISRDVCKKRRLCTYNFHLSTKIGAHLCTINFKGHTNIGASLCTHNFHGPTQKSAFLYTKISMDSRKLRVPVHAQFKGSRG
jgi:hypothetical protein